MASNEALEKKMTEKDLLAKALEAYGIDPKFVLGSRVDPAAQEAMVVTNGGKKVLWSPGKEVAPLNDIEITGINPIKRKPITGPGAKKK